MSISITDALVGKVYSFYAENEVAFPAITGLVIDKERNTITIQSFDSRENISVNIQPWIFAEIVEKENSQIINDELTEIRKKFDELFSAPLSEDITENDAVDAIEEEAGENAALYYLRTGFPNRIFNTIPYILNRNDMNKMAYDLILYAMSSCINDPEKYPYAYLPYMPSQDTIYAKENVEVVRRVARLFRSNLIHSYSLGKEIRFEGYITTFTGDHGWISVSDRFTIRFGRDSIVDERLLNLLKQGIPSTGWIEVSFGISRSQSGFYACRISPTKPALLLAKQQGYYFEEAEVPSSFEDSSICGRKALPAPLLDILEYSESQKNPDYNGTKTGEICYCTEFSDDAHRLVGMIICEGNLYNFHYFQVCDKRIIEQWNQNLLKGKRVIFEAAFNHTKNIVTLNADFIRFEDFNLNIPTANCIDENWGETVYDRQELEAFLEEDVVNKDFVPLQPWLSTYDQLLGGSYVGKVSPNSSRQKGWVYLNNGFRFGFNYSQIQDELLSLIINSPLRDTVNWANIDICFKTRKVNGINVADNVILTNKSRIELAKKLGLELPIVPLSERMIFVERKAFVPITVEQISSQNDSHLMSDEIEAQIVSYNKLQKRIKLLLLSNQQNEEYTLGYITDKELLYALSNDLWNKLTVSYYRRISEEGKLYPFRLKLTESGRNLLDSRRIVPVEVEQTEVIKPEEQKAEQNVEKKEKEKPEQEKLAIGIILPTQKDSPTGYIGNQFYTKACGLEKYPRGTTVFRKQLLAFPLEYQFIYIVQYTYKESEEASLRQATSIELIQKVVYSETGSVQITNNNEIVIQSLYAVCSEKYLHREVSIILFSGETIDGTVESYDPISFSVRLNSDDNQAITIRFDEIERIYIYGMIRPYNPINGTGRLDQYFFFHINNMEIPAEAVYIKDGCAVKYCLRGVKKDNGLEGYNIKIIPIEQKETYIINQIDDTHYITLDAGVYGNAFNPNPAIVCIGDLPPLVDLNICDYKITLNKREKDKFWSYKSGSSEQKPKLFSGILVAYSNQQATVKTIDQYEKGENGTTYNCFQQISYALENGSYASVDTENNDYRILYTLAKQINGTFNLRVVKVCGSIGRNEGYVIQYKDGVVVIKTIEEYDQNVTGTQYRLDNSALAEQLKRLNTDAFDYRVQYTVFDLNGEGEQFRLVNVLGQFKKRRFGTLYKLLIDKNDKNKKYGFIVANEDSDISEQIRAQQHLDYYFKYEAISNPPKDIRTWRNKYEVSFYGGKTSWGGREASDIRFLSIKPIVESAQQQNKVTVSTNTAQLESIPNTSEETTMQPSLPTEINLNEEYGKVENSLFAILRIYSPNFLEIKLFSSYIRGNIADAEIKSPIAIATSAVQIIHNEEDKINTSKNVYLVRCTVLKNDVQEDDLNIYSIDSNYPIEVLKAYRKSQVSRIDIIDDIMTIQYASTTSTPSQEQHTLLPIELNAATPSFDYFEGESLYIIASNGAKYFTEYISSQEDGLLITKKGIIDPNTNSIFRFGIITDFDEAFTWGYINNSEIRLSLSLMEKKAYNMLKAQKRKMLVIYRYELGKITMIDRCDESIWEILPWQDGVVQEYVDQPENKTRTIIVQWNQKTVTHYLSTMSDGYVINRAKKGLLIGEHVYIRIVTLPIQRDDGYELFYAMPDIHCISEVETPIIFDETKEKYMADRGAGKIELAGAKDSLREFVGQKEEILFDIQDNVLVAHIAAAGYAEDDDDYDAIIGTPAQNVFDTSVSLFLQKKLPWEDYYETEEPEKFGSIVQSIQHSSGMRNWSERNACIAFVAKTLLGMDAQFSIQRQSRKEKKYSCSAMLIKSFADRLGEIPTDSQSLDEYFFYANALMSMLTKGLADERTMPGYLYRILQLDYHRIVEIRDFETKRRRNGKKFLNTINIIDLVSMLDKEPKNTNSLIAHLVQFDEAVREYLATQVLPQCPRIMQEITKWLASFGYALQSDDPINIISQIHQRYQRAKGNAYKKITQILRNSRFIEMDIEDLFKFCCTTDEQRLKSFMSICSSLALTNSAGYETNEKMLNICYEKINDLTTEITKQPSLEAVELLYNTGVLDAIRQEIEAKLNSIYSATENGPLLTCVCNESNIERKASILLVLENLATAHQAAEEISLNLESNAYGVRITKEPILQSSSMGNSELQPGHFAVYIADVFVEDFYSDEEPIEIVWTAKYRHPGAFSKVGKELIDDTCDGKITLQISNVEMAVDKSQAVNMYAKYHNSALTDSTMFFGRQKEKKEIMDFLLDENDNFVKGRVVIVYGQKKCGKTSLMYQVMNDLNARKNGQSKAIIINFPTFMADVHGKYFPEDFYPALYSEILSWLDIEINEHHPELQKEMAEKQMVIPDPLLCDQSQMLLLFKKFMYTFMKEFESRYQLIISMDEFTGWCTRIESTYQEHREVLDSMLFVKQLSDMGFIQILIGHANMQRALSTLGAYNQIGQFARTINITAFKKETKDAETVIQQPMIDCFKINPYDSPLGKVAIDYILDMTGRSPFVLMKLCDSIFKKYMSISRSKLTDLDIKAVVQNDIADDAIWSLHEFNFLLEEAGDDQLPDEMRHSFKYLKTVALNYDEKTLDCDADILCDELSREENELVRGMLEDRKVISRINNRIKINVGLFRAFILHRFGKK